MNERVELVVFDLGGVLVRIVRSWAEAHAAAGFDPHPILETPEFDEARRRLALAHQIGEMDPEAYFEAVAHSSHGAYTAADAARVLEAWQSVELPGVDALVAAIEEAGVATGALSNTNPAHWAVLRPVEGPPRFPTVARLRHAHASHLLRLAKPDPAIYAAFEREVGIAGQRIVFFDDLEENVHAARAAGWRAEHVDHAGDTAAQIRAHLERHGVLEVRVAG